MPSIITLDQPTMNVAVNTPFNITGTYSSTPFIAAKDGSGTYVQVPTAGITVVAEPFTYPHAGIAVAGPAIVTFELGVGGPTVAVSVTVGTPPPAKTLTATTSINPVAGSAMNLIVALGNFTAAPTGVTYKLDNNAPVTITGLTSTGGTTVITAPTAGAHTIVVSDTADSLSTTVTFNTSAVVPHILSGSASASPVAGASMTLTAILSGFVAGETPNVTYKIDNNTPVAISGVTLSGGSVSITAPSAGAHTVVFNETTHNLTSSVSITVAAAPTGPVIITPSNGLTISTPLGVLSMQTVALGSGVLLGATVLSGSGGTMAATYISPLVYAQEAASPFHWYTWDVPTSNFNDTGSATLPGGAPVATYTVSPNTPANGVAGANFTFTGTFSGSYTAAPAATYQIDGGTAATLTGVTATGWSMVLPYPAAGTHHIQVNDTTHGVNGTTAAFASSAASGTTSADKTTIAAPSAAVITDAATPTHNTWGITGGVVMVNGVADTTTSGVTELAYVSGIVWQQNTQGLWWGKTSPTAAWSPATGTSTSPLGTTTGGGGGGSGGTRVVGPLATTGKGTWVLDQHLNVAAMPHGFISYNVLLPFGYNDPANAGKVWTIVIYEHEQGEGTTTDANGNPLYPTPGANLVFQDVIDGTFNTPAMQQAFPHILLVPCCDETDNTGGSGENFGGYNDTADSGGNELGVLAMLKYAQSAYKADPTATLGVGDSLGAIGLLALLVDNNTTNGISKLISGCICRSDQLFRPNGPSNASIFDRMAQVGLIAVSTPYDNNDDSYDGAAWNHYTNNAPYPTEANYASGGINAIRAASTQFYYIRMTSTTMPWEAGYQKLNADGGKATALYTKLFSFLPAPTTGGGGSGSTVKVMFAGDSVIAGGGTAVNGGPPPGGPRAEAYAKLVAAGVVVQMVGDQTNNPGGGLPSNQDNHEGIGGYGVITVGGSTVNPGLSDYFTAHNILGTYTPDVLVLMVGANNINVAPPANIGPTATYNALKSWISSMVSAYPDMKIVVSTEVGNPGDSGKTNSTGLGQYNLLLPGVTALGSHVSYVDANANFNPSIHTGPDGVHPNVAGNVIIGDALAAAVVTAINNTGTTTGGTGTYVSKNGAFTKPDGTPWKALGWNMYAGTQDGIFSDAAGGTGLRLFPGTNAVRIPCDDNSGAFPTPASFRTLVNRAKLFSPPMVCIFEDHSGISAPPKTGAKRTTMLAWYAAMATEFKGDSNVILESPNEPGDQSGAAAVSQAHLDVYNTIRNAGYTGLYLVCPIGGGNPSELGNLTPSAYANMHNTGMDLHKYDWTSNYSNSQSVIAAEISSNVNLIQNSYPTADGKMGVLLGEYGPSTDDENTDTGAAALVAAVHQSGLGTLAWHWNSTAPSQLDCITNDQFQSPGPSTTRTSFGNTVATHITTGN